MRLALAAMTGVLSLAIPPQSVEARTHAKVITVTGAWSRPTPPGAPTAAGYLTITNHGAKPDRFVSAETSVAPTLGLHSLTMTGGVMRMRAMPEGLVIGPHTAVKLDPNGYHLMFEGLSKPLKTGDSIPALLHFEKAGAVAISFTVGAGPPRPAAP